jgi:CDP-paratose 2-epimerase
MARKVLITGGAGFIGCDAACAFGRKGWKVSLLDNLACPKSNLNLRWLEDRISFVFHKADLRHAGRVETVVAKGRFDAVLHLAGQVAVTTSVLRPREDFEINALGTLNVLEAVRQHKPDAFVLYASTNKVYGNLEGIGVRRSALRYVYDEKHAHGVAETQALDFHSPYGCSKGAADQYVRDYARIYGLRAVVFRQSCIYGCRQFGVEDQGWVAWFVIAAVLGRPVTIYGDGRQVRDLLFADDLVNLYEAAVRCPGACSGQAYNVGGGERNTLSLLELLGLLREEHGLSVRSSFAEWRPGDQRVYISDIRKVRRDLRWRPRTDVRKGIGRLVRWVKENRRLLE